MPPRLLPPDAPPQAPITAPEAGDAIDYLNLFHVSVGYWPSSSRALVSNVEHPVMRDLGLHLGDPIPGTWSGEADMTYEPRAWDILLRSDRAVTEAAESGLERVQQPAFHHTALMIHRNLRLAVVSGESFSELLADPQAELFRTIYLQTLHYLLDLSAPLANGEKVTAGASGSFEWSAPVRLTAVRYALPEYIDFRDPLWFRKPAPYAHYMVEGSSDGKTWKVLADRTHGPWRGVQTDFVPKIEVRALRFQGSVSNHEPLRISDVEIFRAP
jgi:hypothetical protein